MSKGTPVYIKSNESNYHCDNDKGYLYYCLLDVRHKDGMTLAQALLRNTGDHLQMPKERHKLRINEADSTEAANGVGAVHSRVELL